MYFFLKYLVTLFYKKLRIKIVVSFLCESGPRTELLCSRRLDNGVMDDLYEHTLSSMFYVIQNSFDDQTN